MGAAIDARAVFRELALALVIAIALYVGITLTLQAVHVEGSSMNPTLQNNDLLIASRIDYRLHPPRRGDIVIVRDPYDPGQNFIKRVIGVPGDHVLIRAGHVYVDGERLDEPYLAPDWRTTTNWPAFPDQADGELVPPGEYFVLGDNRDHSSDSRLFGYVAAGQIESRAVARFWPPQAMAVLDSRPALAGAAAG